VRRILVVRLDNMGDVVLAGPAVAALAEIAAVDVLCSAVGRPAARLLPGVDDTVLFESPWIRSPAPPVDRADCDDLVDELAGRGYDAAAILGSSHQSPLPTALLLRFAGIREIAAVSRDYGGALLDHRLRGDPDVHEVRRGLLVAGALGARTDDRPLALRMPGPRPVSAGRVVVHPGSSAPARTLSVDRWADAVRALARRGADVVVTGVRDEAMRCVTVARAGGAPVRTFDRTDLAGLANLLSSAEVVVSGNTGPMHVAAAVGRPIVAVFPPTVPATRWAPWMVPHLLLGRQDVACSGCRASVCPLEQQWCVSDVDGEVVANAVEALRGENTSRSSHWASDQEEVV
jgi:ADP-heptose:LPS heptosyltransferase